MVSLIMLIILGVALLIGVGPYLDSVVTEGRCHGLTGLLVSQLCQLSTVRVLKVESVLDVIQLVQILRIIQYSIETSGF